MCLCKGLRMNVRKNKLLDKLKNFIVLFIIFIFISLVAIMIINYYCLNDFEKDYPIFKIEESQDLLSFKKESSVTLFEIFDDTVVSEIRERETILPRTKDKLPLVAIIIDDIGFDKKIAEKLSKIDRNITFSILPASPFGREIAESLYKKKVDIMLHLPMEPIQYPDIDPGIGAIFAHMSKQELITQVRKNLNAIPYIKGVNNHMGSRLTSMVVPMNEIFTVLKKKDVFFIDSMTSKKSICKSLTKHLQIPFARRDVFLDNIQSPAHIKKQMKILIDIAFFHGTAIGIGHPYKVTYTTLKKIFPQFKSKVKFVSASVLVEFSN
ncbi:MAG: hypothetical protein B6I26_02175 [Desulfobacteraceae bacterium 4572_130]|nr:MAG: hypothetical protein B6I26_02175 [Desulfobacteraceae bacterium 4572_130]